MPAGSPTCEACPPNTVSGPGASDCSACEAGFVSDDGLACAACPPGLFRASLNPNAACTPCPSGTYAPGNGSAVCQACPPRTLCPVATSEPHLLDLSSASLRSEPTRRRARRRVLDFDPEDANLNGDPFEYGKNTGTVTQAVVRTEEETLDRTNRLFAIIGAGAVFGVALVGLAAFLYLRVLPAASIDQRAARYRRVQRLHLLFREEVETDETKDENTAEVDGKQSQTGKHDEARAPTDSDAYRKGDQKGRTVSGAVFSLLAVAAVLVALAFVFVHLNPGVSPSAGNISGAFSFSATFRGYRGACAANADAAFAASGIAGAQSIKTSPYDSGASCNSVTWTCDACRISSISGAGVTLRLTSRLASAVSILYTIKASAPSDSADRRRRQPLRRVFRGSTAVPLPMALTPMHFTSTDDGRPRYFAALSLSDTASAERDPATFGLCSPNRPLASAECADESVYVLVDRKTHIEKRI
eukprot:tig00020805_g14019.t1